MRISVTILQFQFDMYFLYFQAILKIMYDLRISQINVGVNYMQA